MRMILGKTHTAIRELRNGSQPYLRLSSGVPMVNYAQCFMTKEVNMTNSTYVMRAPQLTQVPSVLFFMLKEVSIKHLCVICIGSCYHMTSYLIRLASRGLLNLRRTVVVRWWWMVSPLWLWHSQFVVPCEWVLFRGVQLWALQHDMFQSSILRRFCYRSPNVWQFPESLFCVWNCFIGKSREWMEDIF